MSLCDFPLPPFLPGAYLIRIARTPWERAGHFALRRAVFCAEQGIFPADDRDDIDDIAIALVATTCVLGEPEQVVGAVRIHTTGAGLWRGSRLAVHPDHRRVGRLGTELIRLAVCTAHAHRARWFLAHVQMQNVPLFERLHWRSLGVVDLHGRPHHEMEADLAFYPAHGLDETSLVRPLPALKRAA